VQAVSADVAQGSAVIARSWLFVPGDSDRKLAKIEGCGADIIVLDLEDSVAPGQKAGARQRVHQYLSSHVNRTSSALWVRINPLDTPDALSDLAAIAGAVPDGIVQPKTRSPDDVIQLGHYLDAFERQNNIEINRIRILPVATETPQSLFSLGDFWRCGRRLYGLTWGAEDLSATVGARANKDASGSWTQPYQLARSLCLFGAHAAEVEAVDTLFADFRDEAGLKAACAEARRDGFSGKIAIHPDQVPTINECFVPSAEEIGEAKRVVELFASNPGVAALSLDGKMVDVPHLRQAEKTLARQRDTAAPRG
jgi:citrate lyase subunit beta/citryl-CoA lyase